MNSRILISSLVALSFLAMTSLAHAHEFILKPSQSTAPQGAAIAIEAQAAHVFMTSEEPENPQECQVFLLQGAEKKAIALSVDSAKHALVGTVNMPSAEGAWIVGHRAAQIWSKTTEGILAGDRATLEKTGKRVISVTKYEKFAKTLLNAPKADAEATATLGQELEIVLLQNPATVKAGETIRCKVLLHGKAISSLVQAAYDGASTKADKYVVEVQSNEEGIAEIPVKTAGLWMLRTAQTIKANDKGVDMHNMRAITVFAVQ